MNGMAIIRNIIEQWELGGFITCYTDGQYSVGACVLTMFVRGHSCLAFWLPLL